MNDKDRAMLYLRALVIWFAIIAAWSGLLWLGHTLLGNY